MVEMSSPTPPIADYGGTLDFNANGIAGCCVCGWRGVASSGPEDPCCPVCVIAPETDGLWLEAMKVGRNDPCWCGSGVKFKKCHGR